MPREPVESTLIRAVAYDVPSSILEVELAEGGAVYEYFDVPFSAYSELMDADSKGAYYNDFIKDLYAFRKRTPEADVATLGMLATRPWSDGPAADVPKAPPPVPEPRGRPRLPSALEREITVFRARLPEFLEEHPGEFVLIHGEEVVGFWPTDDEALEAGFDRFGPVEPMLVKQILAVEPVVYFSRSI